MSSLNVLIDFSLAEINKSFLRDVPPPHVRRISLGVAMSFQGGNFAPVPDP